MTETRRIEDDHVVVRLRVLEEVEDVVFEDFDFDVVELGVFSRGRTGETALLTSFSGTFVDTDVKW